MSGRMASRHGPSTQVPAAPDAGHGLVPRKVRGGRHLQSLLPEMTSDQLTPVPLATFAVEQAWSEPIFSGCAGAAG